MALAWAEKPVVLTEDGAGAAGAAGGAAEAAEAAGPAELLAGVLPGAIALGVYTAGVLGRLFAETLENADPRPAQALRASGAGGVATFAYGVLPLVAPKLLGYALYRWEVAIRDTVVVGVVGAGGLGRILEERRVAFDLPGMLGVVLVLLALAVLVDAISTAARRDLREA